MRRSHLTTVVSAVMLAAALVLATASPALAARKAQTFITGTPSGSAFTASHSSYRVTGRLTYSKGKKRPALRSQIVKVQRSKSGQWSVIRRVRTNSRGEFSAVLPVGYRYQVTFSGGRRYRAAKSVKFTLRGRAAAPPGEPSVQNPILNVHIDPGDAGTTQFRRADGVWGSVTKGVTSTHEGYLGGVTVSVGDKVAVTGADGHWYISGLGVGSYAARVVPTADYIDDGVRYRLESNEPTFSVVAEMDGTANYIYLDSDVGDYIGQGRQYLYTQANAQISVSASGGRLSVNVAGTEQCGGNFVTPNTIAELKPGLYASLTRYPFHDKAIGGMDWGMDWRGLNSLSGWFIVDSVSYVDGVLTAVDLRFEQHDKGKVPGLRGTIHWRADDPTRPPGPENPVPDTLWKPPVGSVPATGNYIYLNSDAGDWIGQGQEYLYTPVNAAMTLTASGGDLQVFVDVPGYWWGRFLTMDTITEFRPGYYSGLEGYPWYNTAKGGMYWDGQGRGVQASGWFVVDSVTYVDGVLTAIDLRFEQHNNGASPALHGAIHWAAGG